MDETWCSLLVLFLLLVLFTKLILFKGNDKNLPPSPPSFPLIGHLHLVKNPIHRQLHRLSDQYGAVFALSLGSRLVVVVSSAAAVRECFTKNDIVLGNRPRLLSGKHLNYNYATIGTASYGQLWRSLRRLASVEILCANRINSSLLIRREEVELLLKKLFQTSSDGFAKAEMKSMFTEFSFNVILRMITGKRYSGAGANYIEEATQFRVIISEMFEISGSTNLGDFMPLFRWIDLQGVEKKMLKFQRKAETFLQGVVDESRKNRGESSPQDIGRTPPSMIENLLSLQESNGEFYSDEVIKGLMMTLLTAGSDTSAVTMEWAMTLLLNHPEVMTKARTELDNLVGHGRLVEEADLSELRYLQNIINETLRLFPAAPLLAPHEAADECIVEGYRIPKGTMVLVNAWAVHRDPELWEDAESFRPERFEGRVEGEDGKWIPFGMGRRGCPGEGLANRIIGLALATLLQCFEWKRVREEEEEDMSEGAGITMPKVIPLEALCKPRQSIVNLLSHI